MAQCGCCSSGTWLLCLACAVYTTDTLAALCVGMAGSATEDVMTMFLLIGRLVGPPFLAVLAVRLASGKWPCRKPCSGRRTASVPVSARDTSLQPVGPGTAPLLEGGAGVLAHDVENGTRASASTVQEDGDARAKQIDSMLEEQKAMLKSHQQGEVLRNIMLVVAYIYIVGCAMFTAVVVVRIDFDDDSAWVRAMAQLLCFATMNAEFALLKKIVLKATSGEPVHLKGVHEHALYWYDAEGKGYVLCSMCNDKVGEKTSGYTVLQCRTCQPNKWGYGGFTVCTKCYRKHASKAVEANANDASASSNIGGLRRGDRGPKPPLQLTPLGFCWRVLKQLRMLTTLIALSSIVINQAVGAYVPKAQGDIVNALVAGSQENFNRGVIIFLACVVIRTLMSFGQSISVSYMMTELYTDMSKRLFGSILKQDIAFYDNAMTGQLNARMTNDLGQATMPIPNIMNSLLANSVTLVAGLAICISASWRLTLLAFSFLSPVVYVQGVYSQWASRLQAAQYTYISDAQGAATQAITNIRTVRSFGAGTQEMERYSEHMTKSMNVGKRSAWGQGGATLLSNVLEQGASFIILFYGGQLALGHQGFDVGSIITFTYLWNRLSSAFQGLNDNLNAPVKAMSAGLRVFELMDLEPDIPESRGRDFPAQSSMQVEVTFEDVEFTYQSRADKPILKKVSLTLEAGKTTAIVGKSGCGKSTVSKLLLRFYDPQQGRVCVNAVDLRDIRLDEYRKHMSIVSQDTQLFRRTITENITYGMPEGSFTAEDVETAAKMANADEFIKGLPEGYKTMVGEGGHDLSGGQKQRISIARALVRRPRLLLLDEATSALDAENEALVQGALDSLMTEMQGRCTIMVIAHRLSTIREAASIVVLHEGDVIERGTHEELLEMNGHYANMISRQLQGGGADDGEKGAEQQAKEAQAQMAKLFETLPDEKKMEILKSLGASLMKSKGKGKG